jgi:hypothetical protein
LILLFDVFDFFYDASLLLCSTETLPLACVDFAIAQTLCNLLVWNDPMDSFNLIQQFFTNMSCQHCQEHFTDDSIELIREDKGVYLVSVHCHGCKRQVGVAMVGMESKDLGEKNKFKLRQKLQNRENYPDPELTEQETERLAAFSAVNDDDVLNAHSFIQDLGRNWQSFIPPEMLERCKASDTEALGDET